jgi:hypothetical protein
MADNTRSDSGIDYNGGLEVHSSLLNMVLHETPGITKSSDRQMIGG